MRDVGAARHSEGETATNLFDCIGAFLAEHRLSPEPAHYAFAYTVLTDPQGNMADAVSRIADGGFRLSRQDIERLGGTVSTATPPVSSIAIVHPVPTAAPSVAAVVDQGRPAPALQASDTAADEQAARLVAETQIQVDGFADMMRVMQDETRGFGRDLAQSAAAITRVPITPIDQIDQITQITDAMIVRIHDTEARLAKATAETDRLRDKLAEARDSARRDPLTSLPNRRAFDEAFAACTATDGPYCLAICDIDRFKRINDDHGHGVGDRVLTAIGQALVDACEGHLVVRHGGEEFAVLLKGLDLSAAAAVIDAARQTLAAKRMRNRETGGPLGQITFSAGITTIIPHEPAQSALSRADRLLYTAKADGRDRVLAA